MTTTTPNDVLKELVRRLRNYEQLSEQLGRVQGRCTELLEENRGLTAELRDSYWRDECAAETRRAEDARAECGRMRAVVDAARKYLHERQRMFGPTPVDLECWNVRCGDLEAAILRALDALDKDSRGGSDEPEHSSSYICTVCKRRVPNSNGGYSDEDDDLLNGACDECWGVVTDLRAKGKDSRGGVGGEVPSGGTPGWSPGGAGSNPVVTTLAPGSLREAAESVLDAIHDHLWRVSGHHHWDHTMRAGAGCEKCAEIRDACKRIESATHDLRAALAAEPEPTDPTAWSITLEYSGDTDGELVSSTCTGHPPPLVRDIMHAVGEMSCATAPANPEPEPAAGEEE